MNTKFVVLELEEKLVLKDFTHLWGAGPTVL